jgi:CDP-diacylglycerol--glycerol-3-phosphate 3-phosphatidyltransferase
LVKEAPHHLDELGHTDIKSRGMTLPNKLTVSRLFIAPLFYLLFIHTHQLENSFLRLGFSITLYLLWLYCEISDVLDGMIARKHNITSDMGKLMDPFSDVISRITYFVCFVQIGLLPMWPLLIIIWRELSITFMRAIIAQNGVSMGASSAGKSKAVFYFITSLLGMTLFLLSNFTSFEAPLSSKPVQQIVLVSFILAALASALSFASYLKNFLKTEYMQKFIAE